MSAPVETEKKKPAGAQEVSTGEPTPPKLAQEMHEKALNGDQPIVTDELKAAVAQAIKDEFAVSESWKPKQIVRFVIECPGGQKCLVKHLDTMDLVRADLIEELDFFTKRLFPSSLDPQGNLEEREKDDESTIWSVLRDPEKRCRFLNLSNRLMAAASIKPKIVDDGVALIDDEDAHGGKIDVCGYQVESIDEQVKLFGKPVPLLRDGQCYAGAIDFADRMAFFSELNKPLEMIEPFREKSDAVLASVEPSQIVGDTTERPV